MAAHSQRQRKDCALLLCAKTCWQTRQWKSWPGSYCSSHNHIAPIRLPQGIIIPISQQPSDACGSHHGRTLGPTNWEQSKTVSAWSSSSRQNRFHEVILSPLRIENTLLAHQHLLRGDELPLCDDCFVPLTASLFLTECPTQMVQRRRFFGSDGVFRLVNTALWEIMKMWSCCWLIFWSPRAWSTIPNWITAAPAPTAPKGAWSSRLVLLPLS